MKTFAHFAGASLALALVGLMSGCASTPQQARHVEPVRDFEVVESSAPRPLTDKEMSEVRASVASYLDREGATDSGDYYLKVYLTPQNADGEPEWVVVRFTRYTAERVVLVSDYGYADPYFSPYYSYDLYPYGYAGITTIAFQYYVDPYYGHRYPYYPHHNKPGGPHDDHHHDTANNHDGKPGNPPGDGQNHDHGSRPPPRYYGNRPGVPPQNQNPPPSAGDTASTDDRHHGPRQGGGRADGRTHSPDTTNGNNRPVPPHPEQTVAADQGPRPVASTPSSPRPEPRTISSRTVPVQTEARREPPANRPAPVYRAPANDSGRSSQPAPTHSSPLPASSSGSSSNGDHRAGDSIKQDNLR